MSWEILEFPLRKRIKNIIKIYKRRFSFSVIFYGAQLDVELYIVVGAVGDFETLEKTSFIFEVFLNK